MSDWKTVYRNLNPKEPLAANDPRLERALYTNEFFQNVKDELELNSHTNFKLLVSGHTGCGKATFLNLVAADPEVSGRFHLVKYSVKELLKAMQIDVETARHRIANEFNLFGHHTRILKNILADPEWVAKTTDEEKLDETLLDLLHMPALFQYRNGEIKWYRPYPVFSDWLRTL